MVSLIGALIGFAGSAVPSLFEHFQAKDKSKHDLKVLELQASLMQEGAAIDLAHFQERAADNEHQRLIEHDISMQGDKGFMAGLRKSVRPTITYMFFAIFAAVKVSGLLEALETEDFNVAINLVWDEETQGIFAAIISFWFGSRALEKRKK